MNTFIPLEKLSDTDLHDFHEVWLTTEESHPQDPSHAYSVCLWRAARTLTQGVEIDDVYFEDLPCLWLRVDDLYDKPSVEVVEKALRARLEALKLPGEFYPSETAVSQKDSDARDLRS
jgi:hypothetical protein